MVGQNWVVTSPTDDPPTHLFKIVFVGDTAVGKSSVILRLISNFVNVDLL